jgi:NitT/TauT family transport system substrate-binding protein
VNDNPVEAKKASNDGIESLTGKRLPQQVIDTSWENLTFTTDPVASSLAKSAEDAEAVGLLDPVDLDGIYDLKLLNEVLSDGGLDAVKGL